MSSFFTPAAYSSFKISLMLTLRWLVGCSPPLTRSGTMKTTFAPGKASSLRGFMPMGLRRLSR